MLEVVVERHAVDAGGDGGRQVVGVDGGDLHRVRVQVRVPGEVTVTVVPHLVDGGSVGLYAFKRSCGPAGRRSSGRRCRRSWGRWSRCCCSGRSWDPGSGPANTGSSAQCGSPSNKCKNLYTENISSNKFVTFSAHILTASLAG